SDFVPALLRFVALLGERAAGARGVFTLGRALHLPRGLANRPRDVQLQAGDPRGRLPALDVRADCADLFEAAAERIVHRHADAPRRVIGTEGLAEDVAKTRVDPPAHDAGERPRANELRAAQAAAAIRGLEAHVGQLLIRQKLDVGRGVADVVACPA